MNNTKDEEINKILRKAKQYRKQFQTNVSHLKSISPNITPDLSDTFKRFFQGEKNLDYNSKNNVFINYKLTKKELKSGCTKIIKYRTIDKDDKRGLRKIEVKFPKKISIGQKIIIANCGNYIKENNTYSNLVITVARRYL